MTGMLAYWRRRRDLTVTVGVLGTGWLLAVLCLLHGAGALAPIYSGATLIQNVPPPAPAATVYSVSTYDQTLPFYWRRTLTLVGFRGELDYGLRHESQAGSGSIEEFLVRWPQDDRAYAVMEPATFDKLRARGMPMRELSRDVHRVLVAHP